MKQFLNFLFAIVAMTTVHTAKAIDNGQNPKLNPYVKWMGNIIPKFTDENAGLYLKAAATKGNISGAEIIATPQNYIDVWGPQLYNAIVTAPDDAFFTASSNGKEKNYGINLNGGTEFLNILAPGTPTIGMTLQGQKFEIAKIGSNGCLNPIFYTPEVVEDRDGGVINASSDTVIRAAGGNITINVNPTITANPVNKNTAPAVSGGMYAYNPNERLPCGSGSGFQGYPSGQQVVYTQQKPTFGQTFGGQVLANTIGSTIGNVAAYYITGQNRGRNTTIVVNQPRQRQPVYHGGNYTNNPPPYGPGFPWGNGNTGGTVDNTPPIFIPHHGGTQSTNYGAVYASTGNTGTVYTNGGGSQSSGYGNGFGYRSN
ncbi:hypothetical protein IT401_01775 [Candidatus Nomurabacteria bacterium]|nr:hypothetical protein [Candidatus Nomurabacteria bacterium]